MLGAPKLSELKPSSGSTVSYKIVLSVTNSESMTTSVTSPSGEFETSNVQTKVVQTLTQYGQFFSDQQVRLETLLILDTEGSEPISSNYRNSYQITTIFALCLKSRKKA